MATTGEMPVVQVPCKYLSPDFVKRLDTDYGNVLRTNGGHVTYTIRLDGEPEPRWWEKVLRFLNGGRNAKSSSFPEWRPGAQE